MGRGLVSRGFELVSTGGTAKTLADAGLAVTNVSEVTGFPEMMDGRVKTLHPALHGGILARRDRADDLAALARHGLGLVDVVVVNLYPFVKAASNPATRFDALVEEIDIGGPSMVRAAAKNFRGVLVVVDPADYGQLLTSLDETPTLAFRFELMRKALAHTASYDTAITKTLAEVTLSGEQFERRPSTALGASVGLSLEKLRDLRYGENPHQKAAWYGSGPQASAAGLGGRSVEAASRLRRGVRRVLPLPRRPRRCRRRGCNRRGAAGWLGPRCRSDCRRRRAGARHGLYRPPPLQALGEAGRVGREGLGWACLTLPSRPSRLTRPTGLRAAPPAVRAA